MIAHIHPALHAVLNGAIITSWYQRQGRRPSRLDTGTIQTLEQGLGRYSTYQSQPAGTSNDSRGVVKKDNNKLYGKIPTDTCWYHPGQTAAWPHWIPSTAKNHMAGKNSNRAHTDCYVELACRISWTVLATNILMFTNHPFIAILINVTSTTCLMDTWFLLWLSLATS